MRVRLCGSAGLSATDLPMDISANGDVAPVSDAHVDQGGQRFQDVAGEDEDLVGISGDGGEVCFREWLHTAGGRGGTHLL